MSADLSDNERREREFAREHMRKSKQAGDYHWRKAHMYSGLGDWTAADEGMHWSDNDSRV